MSADIRYGGRVAVDFTDVIATLEQKLDADCANLTMLMMDNEGRHNFEAQVTVLKSIQAGVRTLDVLRGEVDINGERTSAGLTKDLEAHSRISGNKKQADRIIPDTAQKGTDDGEDEHVIDMTKMGRALGTSTEGLTEDGSPKTE